MNRERIEGIGMSNRGRGAVLVLSVLVVGLTTPGLAWAESSLPTTAAPNEDTPHCVITAQPMDVAGPLPAPRCFRTFADAIADATSGTVRLDEDAHTLSRS